MVRASSQDIGAELPVDAVGSRRKAMFTLSQRIAYCLIAVSAMLLFSYTSSRAARMSFTIDESTSYIYHARASIGDIIHYRVGFSPSNNHLLNSLLMKVASKLLGESEFALRLPNVFAHVFYLLFSFLLVRFIHRDWLAVPSFLVLNANPFLLDWFSVARGYGLALALMVGSIYFCMRAFSEETFGTKYLGLASILGATAVIANIPFLDYFLAFVAVSICLITIRGVRSFRKDSNLRSLVMPWLSGSAAIALGIVIAVAVMAEPIWKLREHHEFYYGGTISFWHDTVGSLLTSSLYGQPYTAAVLPVLSAAVIGVVALATIAAIHASWIEGIDAMARPGPLFLSLTVITAIGTIAQHYVLGTKYLLDRTAVMFVPLFALLVVGWGRRALAGKGAWKAISIIVPVIIAAWALTSTWHLAKSVNWSRPFYVEYDASTKQMIGDLTADYQKRFVDGRKVRLAVPPYLELSVNFYRMTKHLDWLDPVDHDSLEKGCDCAYYYYRRQDVKLLQSHGLSNLEVINVYGLTGDTLAARNGSMAAESVHAHLRTGCCLVT